MLRALIAEIRKLSREPSPGWRPDTIMAGNWCNPFTRQIYSAFGDGRFCVDGRCRQCAEPGESYRNFDHSYRSDLCDFQTKQLGVTVRHLSV
jgi:hypothetical protein